MHILYSLFIILTITFALRILAAWTLNVKGVEFGLGIGPKVWGFKIRSESFRINLIPLGEYAKLPMEISGNEKDGYAELCKVSGPYQKIISSITLLSIVVIYLVFCGKFKFNLNDSFHLICLELKSVFTKEPGIIGWGSIKSATFWPTLQCTLIVSFFLNAFPLPINTGGFLLGINRNDTIFLKTYSLIGSLSILLIVVIALMT